MSAGVGVFFVVCTCEVSRWSLSSSYYYYIDIPSTTMRLSMLPTKELEGKEKGGKNIRIQFVIRKAPKKRHDRQWDPLPHQATRFTGCDCKTIGTLGHLPFIASALIGETRGLLNRFSKCVTADCCVAGWLHASGICIDTCDCVEAIASLYLILELNEL